jgi:antitoxin VapB
VKSKEVEIYRRGDEIVLKEKPVRMERALELIASLPEEVLHIRRGKDRPQKRKGL